MMGRDRKSVWETKCESLCPTEKIHITSCPRFIEELVQAFMYHHKNRLIDTESYMRHMNNLMAMLEISRKAGV